MRKKSKQSFMKIAWPRAVFLSLAALLLVVVPAHAAEFKSQPFVSIAKSEVHTGDLYLAGQSVVIDGTVAGDIFAAGSTVEVNGSVDGSIFASGGSVRVTGAVTHSIRVAGGTVELSGNVGRDVIAFGGTVTTQEKASVKGDLVAFAGQLNIAGQVAGKSTLGGGEVRVQGIMKGDVSVIQSGALTVDSGASILGNLSYQTRDTISSDQIARVKGTVSYEKPAPSKAEDAFARFVHPSAAMRVVMGLSFHTFQFLSLILIAIVVLWIFPKRSSDVALSITRSSLGSYLVRGLVVAIVVPIVCIALLFTLIGIPLAIFVSLFLGLLWTIAPLPAAWWIGSSLLSQSKWKENRFVVVFFGLLVLELGFAILSFLPFIGGVVNFLVVLWGFGVLLAAVFPHHLAPQTVGKKA